ncbi:Carbohydrate/starch-binding module (family 21) [Lachnospiraceae bacterium RM5]|nr:Carbohydrate/starch-binding module (family 21) [Lachnospiraceae bacterium RM5]
MRQTRKSKKIVAMMLAVVMIFSAICFKSTISASASETSGVSFYSMGKISTRQGITTYEVFVQTNGNAKDQEVTVHYFYMPGLGWCDAKAAYVATLGDGSKIWRAVITSYDCQFAIKYEADGEVFWDNNNGNDYTAASVIGAAPVTSERLSVFQFNGGDYTINAVLQNFAYEKNVFVRYTTDGWKTYSDQALSYVKTNNGGTETWSTKVPLEGVSDYSGFEYAICYQVNCTEYWANYFGANYDINYAMHY